MKNKEKAISAFKVQLNELDDLSNLNSKAWSDFATDLIKKHIAEDSSFLSRFRGAFRLFGDKYNFDSDKREAKEIMRKCIQYIELLDEEETTIELSETIEKSKSNFISGMSEGWAIFWAGCLISVFGLGGYSIGEFKTQQKIDQQKIDLTNEVAKLKNENLILKMRLTNNLPKKEGSHTKEPNSK